MGEEKNIVIQVDDQKSIEQLCSATWGPLYRFVYFKVQNREEAEDITQETYFKAISYVQRNNVTIEKFISFLKIISLNILRDKWRKNKRQGHALNLDEINQKEIAMQDTTEEIAQREMIENALVLLTEEQRTVIELRILKGYSVADTAKQMDKKEGNVRTLQYRAIQNLTRILKKD